jgi:hypothetical protein
LGSPLPPFPVPFLFFFILTLIECGEIMNTSHYGGEPALHIVVLAVMNCPSGPFRSEFLISNWSLACFFFTVCSAQVVQWRRRSVPGAACPCALSAVPLSV